jgi:hypothetical protein
MKRLLVILVLFFPSGIILLSQYPAGSWNDNMSYNHGLYVTDSGEKIYGATVSGIIIYDPAFRSVSKLSTVNGLSETSLSTIAWSEETSTLIVAYTSTNIDLIRQARVRNMPEIMRKNIPGLKVIYRIRTKDNRAYLACSFGVVVIDLSRDEVYDTWKPGTNTTQNPVYDIAFIGDTIIAATGSGVYRADLKEPGLAYFGNWNRLNKPVNAGAMFNCIAASGNKIFVNIKSPASPTDSVFIWNGSWQFLYHTNGVPNSSFESTADGEVLISSSSSVKILGSNGILLKDVTGSGETELAPSNAVKRGSNLFVADRGKGLVAVGNDGQTEILLPAGPEHNDVVSLKADNGRLFVAGGAVDNAWNNTWKEMRVSTFSGNQWKSLPPSTYRDPLRVIPGRNNNYFISTWGMGLLEYSGSTLLNHYNQDNSPLNTIIAGLPYVRLSGLAFDNDENLWVIHSGVTDNIKVLRPDRTWVTIPVTIDAPTIGDIIITKSGRKWIVLPRGHGLFVYDDNGTLTDFNDDRYRKILVRDTDDNVLSNVYCIAEDLDGNIWVGTDQGPAVYYNTERITEEDIRAVRIKIARNDGSGLADILLKTEIITSISVDGANRKWIGTFNSGAYLVSSDGTAQLKHFTTDNSPLLSNTIVSISADLSDGLVWFGTPNGIISYRSDAPAGKEGLKGAYAFPNPVRHDYSGIVTIAGLVRDTNVKITDISGNLVYEATSTGSEATWNLTNYKGERVSSGVYLAFCATPNGEGTAIVKMLIIN